MQTSLDTLVNSLIYSGIGILVFVVGFFILDMLTPGKLWQEINEKQNRAVAIFAGSVAVGISIIIAAAIHG